MSGRRAAGARAGAALALALTLAPGCGRGAVEGPEKALRRYADAAARGDAGALYAMMTERDRRSLGPSGVARAVSDARGELGEQARALTGPSPPKVRATARVRYADGEVATLELEGDQFRIASADALPADARTPAQALGQLRRVLARRSYAGLLRVLSKETRQAVERDVRALVEGLSEPEALEVKVEGERATVRLRGGHVVLLRREGAAWRVEDFD
ncbi:MAG TPA: hypothetical protein VFS43_15000 [Polyangiaceae bacterium]|nr:hypothetical protein [Polyangiaceae bacterium]